MGWGWVGPSAAGRAGVVQTRVQARYLNLKAEGSEGEAGKDEERGGNGGA